MKKRILSLTLIPIEAFPASIFLIPGVCHFVH